MKKYFLSLVFITLLLNSISAQSVMNIMENDNSSSFYKIQEVSKVVFTNGNYNVNLSTGHVNAFSMSNIKKITFNTSSIGCTDPLAYNYNSTATVSDSCKYSKITTTDSTKTAIDTVGTNAINTCDSVDLKATINYAKIISHLIFGQKIEITWELQQNGNNVHVKALYNLPQKNGQIMFVLTLKCKAKNKTARTTAEEETIYKTFGDVILLGTTNNEIISTANLGLSCYPNPTEGYLTVEANFSETNNQVSIDLYNLNGVQVKHIEKNQTSNKVVEIINIEDLAPGIYLCKVSSGINVLYQKVIKL